MSMENSQPMKLTVDIYSQDNIFSRVGNRSNLNPSSGGSNPGLPPFLNHFKEETRGNSILNSNSSKFKHRIEQLFPLRLLVLRYESFTTSDGHDQFIRLQCLLSSSLYVISCHSSTFDRLTLIDLAPSRLSNGHTSRI